MSLQHQEEIVSGGISYFQQYGKPFQEKIFQGLVTDKDWAMQMYEVMKPSFFDVKYLQYLTEKYFSYFVQYRCFPTMGLVISMIKEDLKGSGVDGVFRDQIINFIHRMKMNPNPEDLPYVKDKALDFCKRQAFKEALTQAVELVQSDKFESVVTLMRKAVSVGMPSSIGHDFFEDLEARFVESQRVTVPTGMKQLDQKEVLDGGLGKGELGVVVAPTGVGKSHWLVAMGAEALRRGKTVVHYTFELSETQVGKRYDANLTDIPCSDLFDNKEKVKEFYNSNSDFGQLIIKYYPTRTASVMTIRNHLEKIKLSGHWPSLVIIDYADVMRSSKQYDALRHELMLIYEELRQLSGDFGLPIWTASQSNKAGATADMVGLENMGEAYGKAQVSDFVVGLSRKPEEKSAGIARLFVAKNRAGMDGLTFPIGIDTATSQFRVLAEHEVADLDPKKALNEAWKQVKKAKGEISNG